MTSRRPPLADLPHHPMDPDRMSDRIFTAAFAFSLGIHLILLIGHLLRIPWPFAPQIRTPLEVTYEVEEAKEELHQMQEQLARATRSTVASPAPATVGDRTEIRIPERPSLTSSQALADIMPDRASVIDLTNLVDAARGAPVLLSYFGAIREQIQRSANTRAWVTEQRDEGLVFVMFTLFSSGVVQDAQVVSDRSAPSAVLQDVALRIVRAASPFPPFPPSIPEPNKTIVVPLEFLLGS